MGTGTKILLVLGVVFSILVLLCCGGVVISGFMMRAYMDKAFTEDPVEIERRRAEMLDLEIPEPFQPQGSVDMYVPFTEERMMTIVIYSDESQKNSIVLVAIGEVLGRMSEEEVERQLDESLSQQGIRQADSGADWETRAKEFPIAGEPRRFVYRVRKDEEGTPNRFEVSGRVAGKRGPVMLMVSADAEVLREEEIDRLIESIQSPPRAEAVPEDAAPREDAAPADDAAPANGAVQGVEAAT